jgi:magnesium-transporting ATPase (P-type)
MTVAYYSEIEKKVLIFVKGAPEILIPQCTYQLDHSFDPVDFDGAGKTGTYYLDKVISEQIGKLGLKPLTIGYKKMDYNQFVELSQRCNNFENEDTR